MLRCDEVTQLCASEEIRGASLGKRLAVRVHLMMCRSCRRYVEELEAMGRAVRRLARETPEEDGRIEAIVRRVLPDKDGPRT